MPAREADPDADQRGPPAVPEKALRERRALEREESGPRIPDARARRARGVLAPAVEGFRELGEAGPGAEEPDPQVQVLGPAPLPPAARALDRGAADHGPP